MALTSTIHQFDIDLADAGRHVYETLALRVPRHPSESEEYLLARVLAYAPEYAEGIAFSRGLSEPDEPALSIRDATGRLRAWIDIGTPDAERLHKASKAAAFSLTVMDDELFVAIGDVTLSGRVARQRLA